MKCQTLAKRCRYTAGDMLTEVFLAPSGAEKRLLRKIIRDLIDIAEILEGYEY